MTAQRNEAIAQMEEQKHKVSLLQEQMTDLKIKLSRYQQEKMQAERQLHHLMMMPQHQRGATDGRSNAMTTATKAWITPPNGNSSHMTSTVTDTEYYQRKCNEANQKVQSYQAMMIEKNRQIDELRYQVERNMNQQQYSNLQHQKRQTGTASGSLENAVPLQSRHNNTSSTLPSTSSQQIMADSIKSTKRQRM